MIGTISDGVLDEGVLGDGVLDEGVLGTAVVSCSDIPPSVPVSSSFGSYVTLVSSLDQCCEATTPSSTLITIHSKASAGIS